MSKSGPHPTTTEPAGLRDGPRVLRIPAGMFADPNLRSGSIRVYGALLMLAGGGPSTDANDAAIVKMTGKSRPRVSAYLNDLERAGYVRRAAAGGPARVIHILAGRPPEESFDGAGKLIYPD